MPAHPRRRPGLRRHAVLPVDRGQARPTTFRRPHRTHQRKRLDPGNHLNSHAVTRGGMFSPFALGDGRAVATWGLSGGRVTIRPLEPMPTTVGQQLYEEAAHVQRYLGVPLTAPRVVPAGY